jgi:wyosine [tRNA(Phe)-imidazoG37] synthetase (radical SAM superfamily)
MIETPLRQFKNHPRNWRENFYVYPVISRRSRGLSIGVNLNPDTACNFDCVYCQVDRKTPPRIREVDVPRLCDELSTLIDLAKTGELFQDETFSDVPRELHRINDIAFSGDGEPTTCQHFLECVALTADLKKEANLPETKIVLITDACYLTKPNVVEALAIMDKNNGEVWAKLDAGTEAYYQTVNRPNYPLTHVLENITKAAKLRPLVIQSLFMKLGDAPPDAAEITAYIARLNEICESGGRIDYVQIYTIARQPAESFVTSLSNRQVDQIAADVTERTSLQAETFYAEEKASG